MKEEKGVTQDVELTAEDLKTLQDSSRLSTNRENRFRLPADAKSSW